MMKILSLITTIIFLFPVTLSAQENQQVKDYAGYVDPFIGTGSIDSLSLSGSTFPGAVVPFGFVQLSPDTYASPNDPASGYNYADSTIVGFSQTHLSGTGVACSTFCLCLFVEMQNGLLTEKKAASMDTLPGSATGTKRPVRDITA